MKQLNDLKSHIDEIRNSVEGSSVILMNEALIYVALDYGLDVAFTYDRESGTSLYGTSFEDAVNNFKKSDSNIILIEKQAPTELTEALTSEGFTVVSIDIMSSYKSDNSADYVTIQYANSEAIIAAFN
jgi:ABC-type Zn uptake system ZnuABC Zn-binding protein ZnuA